jgi:hypothetical protein
VLVLIETITDGGCVKGYATKWEMLVSGLSPRPFLGVSRQADRLPRRLSFR